MAEVIKAVEDESSDSKPVDDTESEKGVGDVKPAKRHLGIPQAVFLVSACSVQYSSLKDLSFQHTGS